MRASRLLGLLLLLVAIPLRAQTIYGVSAKNVMAVDTFTGAQTLITALPTEAAISAIDRIGQRLFLANTTTLFRISLRDGSVVQLPLAGASLREMVFDPVTGLLFGLTDHASTIVTIDPATGTLQPFAVTGISSILAGGLSIDLAGRRLFFIDSRTELEIINLQNATKTSVALASPVSAAQYDPTTSKLIGVLDSFVRVDPSSGAVDELAPVGFFEIVGGAVVKIGYDPATRVAFVFGFTDETHLAIRLFNLNTSALRTVDDSPPSFVNPLEIASLVTQIPEFSARTCALLLLTLAAMGIIALETSRR